MPAGKASDPHLKGRRAVGPGVGRVARSNQVTYLFIVAVLPLAGDTLRRE